LPLEGVYMWCLFWNHFWFLGRLCYDERIPFARSNQFWFLSHHPMNQKLMVQNSGPTYSMIRSAIIKYHPHHFLGPPHHPHDLSLSLLHQSFFFTWYFYTNGLKTCLSPLVNWSWHVLATRLLLMLSFLILPLYIIS